MQIYRSKNEVIKISIGEMIPTETIVSGAFQKVVDEDHHIKTLLSALRIDKGLDLTFELEPSDVVYGLGQSMRGMNKRGYVYESFCSDDPNHTPDKKSLYGAHNFFVVLGEEPWGLYIDYAGKVVFDIGFKHENKIKITLDHPHADLYFFKGSYQEIVNQFRTLIGQSYVPPKWAFGYQQSRWSYEDEKAVRNIAEQFELHDIPVDAIYLDIDYMERYKDFTISEERFASFKTLITDFKQKGLHLVPIIDAGVKIEKDYSVYEEGVAKGYFVKDEHGQPFVAAVWPGKVHFPDFLNEATRFWFGNLYHEMLQLGIEGFWNDMNEPAIFYSEAGLKDAIEFVAAQEGKNLDIHTFFKLKDQIYNLSNAESDYKSMYHKMGEKTLNHYDVHNLYGYQMTRSAAEGFKRYDENKRFLLLTRASHIGMAKHSGIWTGDNQSWWEHLKLNIQMMPALNMSGFLYTGADTGGFGSNVSAELLKRWVQFSLFTPLLRNHSAMGTRIQEPWQFDEDSTKILRDTIRLRYAFVPYIYSEYMKAILRNTLMFSPLSYDYKGARALEIEDQLLLGESIMLTPVYEQNAKGRYVHLPEKMALMKIVNHETLLETPLQLFEAGEHHIKVGMDEVPIFLRRNKLCVVTKPANRVSSLNYGDLTVFGYVNDTALYELYDDDGSSYDFQKGKAKITKIQVTKSTLNESTSQSTPYHISIDTNDHSINKVTFYLIDDSGKCHVFQQSIESIGKALTC